MRRAAALWGSVLALAVAGSGTAIALSRGTGDSGIKGLVVPCGIVLERPAPCSMGSRPATVVVGHGSHVVRRAKVREDGRFRARLDAGRYWLQPRAGKARGRRVRARVSAGEWTTVTILAGRVSPPAARGAR